MIRQALVIVLVLLVGVLVGSLTPGLGSSLGSVVAWLQLPGFATSGANSSRASPAELPRDQSVSGQTRSPEGLIKLSPEQIADQEIETARVSPGALSRHITVPGVVVPDADRVARVPARVVGTVAEMRKRLGDMVQKGEVVAILDSREAADAKSEYLTASVNLDLQKANFERTQNLWNSRVTPEAQYLQARATFSEAQLRADLARQKLSALGIDAAEVRAASRQDNAAPAQSSLRQYEIRAPMAGRVVERRVDVGTAVGGQGDPADLYAVADLSTVWVDLTVPPNDLGKVSVGARVTIVAGGEEERRAEARIMFVSPLLDQETRSARVIASLNNRDLTWRPGSFVTAEVEIARERAKVLVPRAALQSIDGERVVFVRVPDGFQRRDVKVGRTDDEASEILSGLAEGDEIAVKNTFLLKAELGKTEAKHDD